MARGPDFFKQMSIEQIDALEEYARHPGRTVDDVAGYLQDAAVKTSRSAVGRWLQDFRIWDKQQRAADVAKRYLDVARGSDPTAVTEASLRKFEELVLERLMAGDELTADELAKLSQAMRAGLGSRKDILELRAKGREQLAQLKGEAGKRAITADDIERVSKAVFG